VQPLVQVQRGTGVTELGVGARGLVDQVPLVEVLHGRSGGLHVREVVDQNERRRVRTGPVDLVGEDGEGGAPRGSDEIVPGVGEARGSEHQRVDRPQCTVLGRCGQVTVVQLGQGRGDTPLGLAGRKATGLRDRLDQQSTGEGSGSEDSGHSQDFPDRPGDALHRAQQGGRDAGPVVGGQLQVEVVGQP
jgi:hypothetical protein